MGNEGDNDRAIAPTVSATPAGVSTVRVRLYNVRYYCSDMTVSHPRMDAADGVSATYHIESSTSHVKKAELLDGMKASKRGDIFTTFTHCYYPKDNISADPIGLKAADMWGDLVSVDEIVAALRASDSPSVVILCGCGSAAFLDRIMSQTGVSVAYGISGRVIRADCSKAADAITAALMTNATLTAAKEAGQSTFDPKSFMNSPLLEVVLSSAEGVRNDLSLLRNQLLPRYRSPNAQ